jgi:hypothetical protein
VTKLSLAMGLLDFFRRRGASEPGAPDVATGGGESPPDERAHGPGVPAGSAAEGPPVGVSDPGSLTGEDADRVAEREEAGETAESGEAGV